MPENNFDILIIGGGPGGYVAAIRAAQLGLTVACVEVDKLGGVCLNTGCIPTKALLTSAALVNEIKTAGAHGITFSEVSVDLAPAQERSRAIAEQLANGVGHLFTPAVGSIRAARERVHVTQDPRIALSIDVTNTVPIPCEPWQPCLAFAAGLPKSPPLSRG